jgi:hypothetical protein
MAADKAPPSLKKASIVIQEIISLGEIEIPTQFNGSGMGGETLEYLCEVERNNLDAPDLLDWEVKFHGGKSLLTFLHKDPEPVGILDKVVDTFGWKNKENQMSFRHTIRGQSKRGFIVKNENQKITVFHKDNPSIAPFWQHNLLLNTLGAKLRRLIVVQGKVDRLNRRVLYQNATAWWGFNLIQLFEYLVAGIIYIDFDARTTGERGTSLRNHGTKFRVRIKDLPKIYTSSKIIV